MYHEEQVIDGVLCHRGTPDGEWEPYTLKALTIALTAERAQNEKHRYLWTVADIKLREIQDILHRKA